MFARLLLALVAAAMFTLGGLAMKPSAGLTRLGPTLVVLGCFVVGAALNTLLVRLGDDVGPAYLAVVGCETVLAFGLGALVYGERVSASRLGALALVLTGVLLLAADAGRPSTTDAVTSAAQAHPSAQAHPVAQAEPSAAGHPSARAQPSAEPVAAERAHDVAVPARG